MAQPTSAMAAEETDASAVAPEIFSAATQQPFGLPVLQIIRTSQAQNGIKHGDHMRYRRHCTNKLRSLFKVLRFQHGRTKYQKRKLDLHNITDVRHLHILLFNTERCWALAMELKKGAETTPELAARKRHHLVRRLSKAQVWAAELARFAAAKCDTRSALEAEGYSAWLAGQQLLEKATNWLLALAKFTRAKRLFGELAKVGDLEQQSLCLQTVEEMEPSLRYCSYQITRQGGAVPDAGALVKLGNQEGQESLEQLQTKLSTLAVEAKEPRAEVTTFLEWRGQRLPVRNDRVKACLRQTAEYDGQLGTAMDIDVAADVATSTSAAEAPAAAGAAAPGTLAHRLSVLDRMVHSLVEARGHVRNAIKSSSASEADGSMDELAALETALTGTILQRVVERHTLLERDASERFAASLARQALGKRSKEKGPPGRPEDVARAIDTLTRHLEEYADFGANMGGRRGEELHDVCTARVAVLRAFRCYHIAHVYLAANKAQEAYALFGRAKEHCSSAAARLSLLPSPAASQEARGAADLSALAQLATAYRVVAHAEYAAESATVSEAAQAGVASLALGSQQDRGTTKPTYLADDLDRWESFAGTPATPAVASGKGSGGPGAAVPPRLLHIPPPLQALAVRPIMLDTASGHLRYPSLEHRVKKVEKKPGGVLSSLFGGWGR